MAERDKDGAHFKRSKTLVVRHLPADLSREEKEDLLVYFGASSVRLLSDKGPLVRLHTQLHPKHLPKHLTHTSTLPVFTAECKKFHLRLQKHTAFATFSSESSASKALRRLHQLRILGHTLVVEFAKDQDNVVVLKSPKVSDRYGDKTRRAWWSPQVHQRWAAGGPLLPIPFREDIFYQTGHELAVVEPPCVASAGVLECIDKVLHLMNKMNLPCPFGPMTNPPPMYTVTHGPLHLMVPPPPMLPPENPPLPKGTSDEESEYESGDDEDKERMIRLMGFVNQTCKRPLKTKMAATRKKPKLKDLLFNPKPEPQSAPGSALRPSDVFEQMVHLEPKKIEFHIAAETSAKTQNEDEDEEEETREEAAEIKRMSVFKNYHPGEPTCRLYVKNIAKAVEEKVSEVMQSAEMMDDGFWTDVVKLSVNEFLKFDLFLLQDLKYIYSRYIDTSSEDERNSNSLDRPNPNRTQQIPRLEPKNTERPIGEESPPHRHHHQRHNCFTPADSSSQRADCGSTQSCQLASVLPIQDKRQLWDDISRCEMPRIPDDTDDQTSSWFGQRV
ncbi:RNA-binding protein 40 [Bagarius yarrelli]|uniref:RNA-binding region-containing protein 3 n=1 Tax=Bagarius yarrelli TaxID=175774 RepID=A0A556V530_BAGYA|nr:RNA-binding protein 40 [Bagarius yarrelli]